MTEANKSFVMRPKHGFAQAVTCDVYSLFVYNIQECDILLNTMTRGEMHTCEGVFVRKSFNRDGATEEKRQVIVGLSGSLSRWTKTCVNIFTPTCKSFPHLPLIFNWFRKWWGLNRTRLNMPSVSFEGLPAWRQSRLPVNLYKKGSDNPSKAFHNKTSQKYFLF